ncbi:Abi family protein [Duganella levis]|uniref:Abi family protein n=1 Tax=Duganella levis TaxID=2692169 RepID=A0ABW9VZ53_9BURK|nr:Abi family protein [Duganella levis]MYN26981.1 hypothetical protein [Duganella levis]
MSNENLQQKNIPATPDISEVLKTVGSPRLDPYRVFFQCDSDTQLLGAYFWGQTISVAFQPTLAMYEIALRNAVHRSASDFSSKGTSESYPWYDRAQDGAVRIGGKTLLKLNEVLYSGEPPLRRSPQPSPDSVVASLSFGFWPSMLAGLSKREQTLILSKAFRAHPKSHPRFWGVQENVTDLISTLKGIQDLRNAVAHHEPIWKSHRLSGAETHWSQSVRSLREKHAAMLTVMAWCCPASAAAAEHSFATRLFKSICSTNAVLAFKVDPFGAGRMQLFNPPVLTAVSAAGQ